jgi:hypothetical protein
MSRTRMLSIWSDTTLVVALSNSASGWIDIGRRCPYLEVIRSSTGGTYAFEIDWSTDGGSTTLTTDTITTTAATFANIPPKARWCRCRARNTHATLPFTVHSTVVTRDAATGF